MTWVEFLREFGFPGAVVIALFWLVVLPLKDRFIRHLDAIEEFFKIAPKMLGKLEHDAHMGAKSLKQIVEGQQDAASRIAELAELHDGRLSLVSNVVTHEVLGHLADALLEMIRVAEEAGTLDPRQLNGVRNAIQEMARKVNLPN